MDINARVVLFLLCAGGVAGKWQNGLCMLKISCDRIACNACS